MEIKEYKINDELAILDLFKSSFKKELPLNYWEWRFKNNPQIKTMIKLMWDKEVLAGHYAVSPAEMLIDDKVELSALSMTTMTHPNYGGKGIFTTLAESLYNSIQEEHDVKFVWGFPNNNSHYGFIKNLKWKDLSIIPTLSLSINKFRETNINTFSIKLVSDFDEKHSIAFKKITSSFPIKTNRSLEYLKWRFIKNPSVNYSIFEFEDNSVKFFAVTKSFISFSNPSFYEVDIVDLFFPPDQTLMIQLIQKIIDHYGNLPLLKLNLWIPLNDSRHLVLEKIGFTYDLPVTYIGARALNKEYENALYDFRNWYFSMSDSDVF